MSSGRADGPDVVPGAETRQLWLEQEPQLGGRLRLLRSPWTGWTLRETLNAMWRWLERPDVEYDADSWLPGAADVLRWDENEARQWRPQGDALEE